MTIMSPNPNLIQRLDNIMTSPFFYKCFRFTSANRNNPWEILNKTLKGLLMNTLFKIIF